MTTFGKAPRAHTHTPRPVTADVILSHEKEHTTFKPNLPKDEWRDKVGLKSWRVYVTHIEKMRVRVRVCAPLDHPTMEGPSPSCDLFQLSEKIFYRVRGAAIACRTLG
jgi:hypothetical protein